MQFLVDLCRPSQLSVGPLLRGFYFTGVRPIIINEAAPVAAAAPQQQAGYGTAAGATGIFKAGARAQAAQAAPPQVGGTRKVPQWLFLSHLFTDVLLADRAAMGASGASTKTSFARRAAVYRGCRAVPDCSPSCLRFRSSRTAGLKPACARRPSDIAAPGVAGADLASVESLRKLETLRQSLETAAPVPATKAPRCSTAWAFTSGTTSIPKRGAFISTASASCCSRRHKTAFCNPCAACPRRRDRSIALPTTR